MRIWLPALIAIWTWTGAPAGAMAAPLLVSLAFAPGAVAGGVVVPPGATEPPVCAKAEGAATTATVTASDATRRAGDRKPFSFVGLRG